MQETNDTMTFSDFPLEATLLEGIAAIGFDKPTPIQQAAIPIIVAGKDMIGSAQTGTGKTAAFVIPTLNRIMQMPQTPKVKALIITPTRELALQIDQTIEGLGYFTGVSSLPIYGGNNKMDWDRQIAAIKNGVDIIVATPGRLLMHLSLGYLDFSETEMLILDEADKMLDMGFYNDILRIVKELPEERQALMFSATMPPKMRELARKILKKGAEEVNFKMSKPAENIHQEIFYIEEENKLALLGEIMKAQKVESMIIFAASRVKADGIHANLIKSGYEAKVIHSDKGQDERQQMLLEFKNKQYPILVATDILARGIDIDNLTHVLNFDVPHDPEDYVHRIGRTARAGGSGTAITFVSPREKFRFRPIEQFLGRNLEKWTLSAEGIVPYVEPPRAERPPQSRPPQNKGEKPQNRPPQNRPPQNRPPQNKEQKPQNRPPQNRPPQNRPPQPERNPNKPPKQLTTNVPPVQEQPPQVPPQKVFRKRPPKES